MDKTSVVVSCPIDTYSGYGARSRDLVKALIALGEYDVKILAQRWGTTRTGYLKEHQEHDLHSRVIPNISSKPDVWIQITVPNEFQPVGKYNIGITAGIETTLCPMPWIEGLNKMNLVLTSSNHSKRVLSDSKWTVTHKQTKKEENLSCTTPIEVLFEGIDNNKYKVDPNNNFDLSSIKEEFCFLFVGHWLQGDFKHDRKNIGYTIKAFLQTFKNKPNPPALILKTQHANASLIDLDAIKEKISSIRSTLKGKLPNIYIIHGEVSDKQINDLYNNPKVKAMVCLTKGEGFGRPLLEFSVVKKPIIASGWSGQIDFLDPMKAVLIGGELENVHQSAAIKDVLLPEAQWFQVNDGDVGKALKSVHTKYKKYVPLAKQLGFRNQKEFSFESMTKKLGEILNENLPEFPKQVELNLPSLNIPKIELPKLK